MPAALQQLLCSLVNALLVLRLTMEAEFAAYMQLAKSQKRQDCNGGHTMQAYGLGLAPVQPIADRDLPKPCCTLHIQSTPG